MWGGEGPARIADSSEQMNNIKGLRVTEPDAGRFNAQAQALMEAGRWLYGQGWVPATSGNFSARVDDANLAVTVSGRHKGALGPEDIMAIDADGNPRVPGLRSSAETLLHVGLYRRFAEVGAVLHTHSVNATVLSRRCGDVLVLEDYELLKAFDGVETHAASVIVPVFDNDQDIPRLAAQVEAYLASAPDTHGYLIRGHGLYTWGRDVAAALRHVEAFEFLFQCEMLASKG